MNSADYFNPANIHPSLVAALESAPELNDSELGSILHTIVLRAFEAYDDLPKEQQGDPAGVVGLLTGVWTGGLAPTQVCPLVREARQEAVKAGLMPIPTAAFDEALEEINFLQRSPSTTVIMAVSLVLSLAPNATRVEQANAAISLLRQLDGWLPTSLMGPAACEDCHG